MLVLAIFSLAQAILTIRRRSVASDFALPTWHARGGDVFARRLLGLLGIG